MSGCFEENSGKHFYFPHKIHIVPPPLNSLALRHFLGITAYDSGKWAHLYIFQSFLQRGTTFVPSCFLPRKTVTVMAFPKWGYS